MMWTLLMVVGAATILCLATEKSRKLSRLALGFIVHYTLIVLEDKIWRTRFGLPGPLPRNLGEIIDAPSRLENLLQNQNVISENEHVVEVVQLAGIKSEPAKRLTAGSVKVTIASNDTDSIRELKLFCKFQTGRGMPFWLQAIRAAAEPGVCREVDFYANVRESVPVKTLTPYLTLKYPSLNYVMVALEYIDLDNGQARVVNDATGATLCEVKCMMTDVAKIHARFMGGDEPETSWIPARNGLEYAGFVESFTDKAETVWTLRLWGALKRHFASHPVTMVHGDCRPGNMMFEGTDRNKVEGLIFADWEATNIAPIMWDLTYCTTLGWSAAMRRGHLNEMIDTYLESLSKQVIAGQDLAVSYEQASLDVALLTIVLGYVSRTVRVKGFWANQGNTDKDKAAWFVRVALAIADLDASVIAPILAVSEEEITMLQESGIREVQSLLPNLTMETLVAM